MVSLFLQRRYRTEGRKDEACEEATDARKQITAITTKADAYGSVVDLFCGAGGLTHGLLLEGFTISAGLDVDEDCRYPFEHNNRSPFIRRDITGFAWLGYSLALRAGDASRSGGVRPMPTLLDLQPEK